MKSKIQTLTKSKIPSGWQLIQLKKVAKVIDPNPTHRAPVEIENGFPYVGIRDILADGTINVASCRKVGEDAILKQEKLFEISENLFGFGRNGTVGKIVKFKKKNFRYAISPHFAVIKNTENIDGKFLYFAVKSRSFLDKAFQLVTGTTRPTVGIQDLREIPIAYPPFAEQKQVGIILSSLDCLIENIKNQNKILEIMIKSIYKSWFVDFDGETEFIDTELGDIPKGWEVKKLDDFINIEKGLSYKGKFLSDNGIPLINLGNFNFHGGFRYEKIKHYVGDYKEKHLVDEGDILLANTDITQERIILGSPIILPPYLKSHKIIFTHHVFAVRNYDNLGKFYLNHLLQTTNYRNYVISYATGTTVLAIPKEAVLSFTFAYSKSMTDKFEKISEFVYNKIYQNQEKVLILTKILDSLLPKLVSGEIRV